MALTPGEHVGPFEILSSLGAGGMGEVYRGRDPQLRRDVAIKVLPDAMRRDAMRLARFEREARVLAALTHPNIAAIHGLEQHDGINALILELVEGETLASRIAREPITVTGALAIAGQVAAALDAAHEKGVVHRDLKPANIVVTPTGLVKVLDFGLATIAAPGDARGEETRTVGPTHEGMVVGTPAYMSPEQARGLPVDKRTDIWAFGCVLYEMLTGRRLFDGDSAAQTLAFVLTKEIDWSALPSQTPFAVRALLRRCLEREPAKRLGDVAAVRFALEDVSASAEQLVATRSGEAAGGSRNVRGRTAAGAAVAILLIVAIAIGFIAWKSNPTPAQSRSQHLHIALPPGQRLAGLKRGQPTLAMSPDDNYIAYVATAQEEDARQIYLYSIERGTSEPVSGSVGAHTPFFSPDEEWLGFFSQDKMMKIPVKGGIAPAPVTDIVNPGGASWTDDHRIVAGSFGSVLQVLGEEGGVPEALTRRKPGDTMHRWPSYLPGGKALLFNVDGTATIAAQQIGAADRRDLTGTAQGILPQYSPSGHVVYAQAGSLFATPFDPTSLQAKGGAPTKVISGVLHALGVAHFSVSARGGLAYVPGEFQQTRLNLVHVSRSGTIERTLSAQRNYNQPRVAPDARRLVVDIIDGDPPLSQLWLYDLRANELNQFTYRTDRDNRHATWVDSNRLVVQSNRKGTRQLFLHPVDGGAVEQLSDFPAKEGLEVYSYPVSFCGDALSFVRLVPNAEGWVLHMSNSSGGRKEPLKFPMTADGAPSLSPDCRWLAYVSDESGRREVWVRAFSNLGKGQQISKGGGNEPAWNPDRNKKELFYRDGEFMMAARINDQGSIEGKAERLFADSYTTTNGAWSRPNYDVFPDGSFLMLKQVEQEQVVTRIIVVLNWREELTRLTRGN
jgi:serine/threonine-protein kinase